jgi:hypothetical protein
LAPTYLTRPNCLRELRWALDFARSGKKRVVLLPLHPAVTHEGLSRSVHHGLLFSSKETSTMRVKPAAVELLSHVKFKTQNGMTQLQCHELQKPARAKRGVCVVRFRC